MIEKGQWKPRTVDRRVPGWVVMVIDLMLSALWLRFNNGSCFDELVRYVVGYLVRSGRL